MTKFAVLLMALLSSSAVAFADSPIIVKGVRKPGLERHMLEKILTLQQNGEMHLDIYDYRSHARQRKYLGHLSPSTVDSLTEEIRAISPESALVDAQAGRGFCYDLPSTAVFVVVNNQEREVARKARCHTWHLPNFEARRLADLTENLLRF